MNIVLYKDQDGCTVTLITDLPDSSGVPVLRAEGDGYDDWPDMGAADRFPCEDRTFNAGHFVASWADGIHTIGYRVGMYTGTYTECDDEGYQAAARFCGQYPKGQQPIDRDELKVIKGIGKIIQAGKNDPGYKKLARLLEVDLEGGAT